MNNLIWLASYPKSGNTWLRLFLTDLLGNKDQPVNINEDTLGSIISDPLWLQRLTGISTELLTPSEINALRKIALCDLNRQLDHHLYFKVHDQFTCPHSGEPIVPVSETYKAVYIIRNPLDITLSFANYYNQSVDETIKIMANRSWRIAPINIIKANQFEQYLGHWSDHVNSWCSVREFPVKIVRYEDLLASPVKHFKSIARFLDLNVDEEQIKRSVDHTRFDRLKEQEEKSGFQSNPSPSTQFFRKGQALAWKEAMTPKQVDTVYKYHEEVMATHGYGI